MRLASRGALKRIGLLLAFLAVCAGVAWFVMLRMPGESHDGAPGAPDERRARQLRTYVELLAGPLVGERNVFTPVAYARAADEIEALLVQWGYTVRRQRFESSGTECVNLEVERTGGAEIVVVGAHYDSIAGSPGANDNASGVAAVLSLAYTWARRTPARTVRFLFFANEEPPFFQKEAMGSLVYARRCRAREEKIVAMLSLETIGYFSDEEDSQSYPIEALKLTYPSRGNYIGFVGNVPSAPLVRDCLRVFREHASIPSEGAAMLGVIQGVGWSDHWAFWQAGYAAIMVTDTAPFRYPWYHTAGDTPDKLDFDRMALVVEGLEHVLAALADP